MTSGKIPVGQTRINGVITGIVTWRGVTPDINNSTVYFQTGNQPGSQTNTNWLIPIYIIVYKN